MTIDNDVLMPIWYKYTYIVKKKNLLQFLQQRTCCFFIQIKCVFRSYIKLKSEKLSELLNIFIIILYNIYIYIYIYLIIIIIIIIFTTTYMNFNFKKYVLRSYI